MHRFSQFILLCAALIIHPADAAESSWDRAVRLYNQRDFRGALNAFQTSRQQGKDAEATYYMGLCYQQLGDLNHAKQFWQQTVDCHRNTAAGQMAATALQQWNKIYPASAPGTGSEPVRSIKAAGKSAVDIPDQVEVPFRRLASGHIIVPCAVNGKAVDMMFDTGANDCFFTQEDFDKLKEKVPPGQRRRYIGVGGEVSATLVPVKLSVGGLSRRLPVSVQEACYQRTNDAYTLSYPLLGQNFFGDLIYQIDSSSDVIRFLKSSAKVKGESVPYTRDYNNLIVTAKVNGRECEMILDTGADSVCFSDKHLAALGVNRPIDADAGYSSGVGGQRRSYSFTIDSIKLGTIEKRNVTARVALDSCMNKPLLGASFLKDLIITFDPSSKMMKVSE